MPPRWLLSLRRGAATNGLILDATSRSKLRSCAIEEAAMIRARHILVEQEYEAKDLEKKLQEGETFEQLAQKFSRCPSGKKGGDLGFFREGQMVEAFEEAAFALK